MNNLVLAITIFVISLVLLISLVSLFTKFSVRLGQFFGISNFTLSFILAAFATSLPELILGFISSIKHVGSLGLGIALGANIINLTLITGLIAVFARNLTTRNAYQKRLAFLLTFIAGLALLTLLDGNLSRLDGLILISAYFIYLYELWFARSRESTKKIVIHYTAFLYIAIMIIITVASLILVSDVLVDTVLFISNVLGITPIILGVIFVSASAAIPELIFEFRTIKQQGERMALGDLIGAVGTNISLVIGLIALINPINILLNASVIVILFFSALAILLFLIFLYTKQSINVKEGLILIIMYIIFLTFLFISALTSG